MLPRLDGPSTSAQDIADHLQKHGVVVVDNLVPPSEMETLRQDLSQTGGRFHGSPGSFAGSNTVRNAGKPLGESKIAQSLAEHPVIVEAVQMRLKMCRRIVLGTCSAIDIHPPAEGTPSAPPQVLHRDEGMWGVSEWPWIPNDETRPELSISVMWACSDFTKENGCTRFIPGSHFWDRALHESHEVDDLCEAGNAMDASYAQNTDEIEKLEEQVEFAEMCQGSVVLWSGGTLHGAGSYESDKNDERHGLLFIYNLSWLRSEQNFHWAIPGDVMETFPTSLKELIGYIGTNRAEHPWFSGPVYAQPLLGG